MTTFRVTYDSDLDALGRRSFTIRWVDADGRERGQCYRTFWAAWVEATEAQGHTVILPDLEPSPSPESHHSKSEE